MRIAFLLQDLFTTGVEYATALIVRGFVAKGYEVDLVVSKVHTDLLSEGKKLFEVPDSVHWVILPSRKARRNIFALRRYLRKTDAHSLVIMSSNYLRAFRFASIGLYKLPQTMYVEHLGTVGVDINGNRVADLTYKARLLAYFYYQRCNQIGAVSSGTRDAMVRLYPWLKDKLTVVYNPVIDNVFWDKINRTDVVHPWLQEKKCFTIIAAGSHTGLKNHRLLIDAVVQCQSMCPVRLVLFGRGELTSEYEQLIREQGLEEYICLGGFTDNLPLQLKYADAFVVSSNIESFSIVLVEALASGCPIISTDCPYGPREVLADGKYGTLVPVKDSKALANAILNLARQTEKPKIPEESWSRFTVEKITERYERAFGLIQ